MAERRVVGARPHPAPVRDDGHHPPRGRQYPPYLAQKSFGIVGHFQRVHQEDAVDRGVTRVCGSNGGSGGRDEGGPWPTGVWSVRAHTPRGFGMTPIPPPEGASTRHISRKNPSGSSDISSACTKRMRSTAASGSG